MNMDFKIYSLVGNIKSDLVKYFMQQVRNVLILYICQKNNICKLEKCVCKTQVMPPRPKASPYPSPHPHPWPSTHLINTGD